jgi:hypothetical protein
MAKTLKVEKEVFERTMRKMLNAPPAPKADMPKSKKKLTRIVEPITR